MSSENLRLLWTVVGAIGSTLGLCAAGVGWYLMRDAARTEWAISQVRTNQLDAHRLHTRGDVVDSRLLELAIGLLFLAVSCQCGAGLAAEFALGGWAIVLLVAAELLTVASLGSLVVLGGLKLRRRNRITSVVRASKPKEA